MTQLDESQAVVDAPAPDADAKTVAETPVTAADMYPEEAQAPAEEGGDPADEVEGSEGSEPDLSEEGSEPAEPAIAPPNSWSDADKAEFSKLTPEAQAIVARRETERDKFVQAKAQEAAQTRATVEREAQAKYTESLQVHAARLQQYAQMFEVQPPDPRLLYGSEHEQAAYYQQDRDYRFAEAQRQQAQQAADEARRAAEAEQGNAQKAEQAEQHRILTEAIPEWSDPAGRTKLLSNLEPIGAALGYSSERLSNADAHDIIALKKITDWKAKADKYDQINKAKMEPVRAAKRVAPVARAGAASEGPKQAVDVRKVLYPND